MAAWETLDDESPVMRDYAGIWRAADKIVYSRTLDSVSTPKTRLVHDFEPDAVRELKDSAPHDLSVGGPGLAGEAIAAGLVDEISLFLTPVAVGGGTPALPRDVRVDLELLEERRFASGVVYLRYRARNRSISERTRG
jgi:dihydrofolate reductase